MSEDQTLPHRVGTLEKQVDALFSKVNDFAVGQATTNTRLDNVFVVMGELKEIISQLQGRPGQWWDKLISGVIGAGAAAIVAFIIK